MTTVTFPIEHVLSVTTGVVLTEIDNLYIILGYLTRDDNLFTHQLPRAADKCRLAIFAQHPDLEQIDDSHINRDNWQEFIAEMKAKFGDTLPLTPITDWELKNPVQELADMIERAGCCPICDCK